MKEPKPCGVEDIKMIVFKKHKKHFPLGGKLCTCGSCRAAYYEDLAQAIYDLLPSKGLGRNENN